MASLPAQSWPPPELSSTFSLNIVSLYSSLWMVHAMGGIDAACGNVNSISMALMFFTAATSPSSS